MQTIGGLGFNNITVIPPVNSSFSYWFSVIDSGDPTFKVEYNYAGIKASATTNSLYIAGSVSFNGYDMLLMKFDLDGNLIWQRRIGTASEEQAWFVVLDSADNAYMVGQTGGTTSYIVKYDANGNLQWQKTVTGSILSYGMAIDSTGNLYCAGSFTTQFANNIGLMKLDSNGSVVWSRSFTGVTGDQAKGIAVDNSGNVYVTGVTSVSGGAGGADIFLAKFDSSGNVQWQRSIGSASGDGSEGIKLDSNGDPYVIGTTASKLFLAKYDSSGTLQWQRELGVSTNGFDLSIYQDHVYAIGIEILSEYNILLAKYDLSGNLIWQRKLSYLSGSSTFDFGRCIDIDNTGTICISGYLSSPTYDPSIFLARLPNDGSKTGTYNSVVYANTSYSSNTSVYSSTTRNLTVNNISKTSANSSMSNVATTLSVTKTMIS